MLGTTRDKVDTAQAESNSAFMLGATRGEVGAETLCAQGKVDINSNQ